MQLISYPLCLHGPHPEYITLLACEMSVMCGSLKVMLKILQARLQQYVNRTLPDVQAGFRKGRGTRDQIANIHWVTENAREFQLLLLLLRRFSHVRLYATS